MEPAKLHFTARIAQEKAEEIQSHQELTRANKQPTVAKPLQADKAPLTILRRDGKKVRSLRLFLSKPSERFL